MRQGLKTKKWFEQICKGVLEFPVFVSSISRFDLIFLYETKWWELMPWHQKKEI